MNEGIAGMERKSTRMKKRALAAAGAAVGLLALVGCGRNIDINQTGAQPVPGANGLYRMCDGPTLVYFSHWDSREDDYEATWPGWCVKAPDGKWSYDPAMLPATRATANGNSDEGDH